MHTPRPSELLEGQHHEIDQGVAGIVDGTGQLPALSSALALLRLHLYMEEEILFPPLVKSGLTMPVFVMKREHGEMWPLMQNLDSACGTGDAAATLQGSCLRLFQLLRVHNPKEEQIVYTAADRLVAGQTDGLLVQSLQAARVPDGWVCAMAPR